MAANARPEQKAEYWEWRRKGKGKGESAALVGVSRQTAAAWEKIRTNHTAQAFTEADRQEQLRPPLEVPELCEEAKRALVDFGYFQQRYFGRIPLEWQVVAANEIAELLADPDKKYLVQNGPPGSGKTILYHDLAAWLTARNRQIRGMFGAATGPLAARYTNRLRRTLSRTLPEKASDDDKVRGLALDAEATMSEDFGRFQALDDTWTKNAFVVEQYEGHGAISEKEPTWSAYGADEGYIGGRYDICIWDDLVDPKKLRTAEAREALEQYWDTVSEARLEPGGLLILVGQRLSSDDLYRYNIDKVAGDEEDEDGNLIVTGKKYHHMKFMAHYEDKCRGKDTHARDAPAWPEGCLLSPRRLPWVELSAVKNNRNDHYEVVYQQGDSDPASVLVRPDWIYGRNGSPGCVDEDRDRLEIPRLPNGAISLAGDLFSVMTVDPSPTKYWAILWIVYSPTTEFRYVMDLERAFMGADEFLDFDYANQKFSGLLPEWLQTSRDLGMPITHVIVETNAAQKFLLQYDHVRRWMAKEMVDIVSHDTHRNKSDPEFGVDSIRQHFQFGRYRLPYKRDSQGMFLMRRYIEELTNYPHGRTDDMVMATWFFEWQLPRLYVSEEAAGKEWRPSWSTTVPDRRKPTGVESGRPQLAGRF